MSADAIRFFLPPHREARAPTDFPTIAFRAAIPADVAGPREKTDQSRAGAD